MILEQKRTLRSYYEKIQKHSLNSQKGTKNALNNFDLFCKEKYDQGIEEIVDDLVLVKKQETVFDILQNWINWNKIAPSFQSFRTQIHVYSVTTKLTTP